MRLCSSLVLLVLVTSAIITPRSLAATAAPSHTTSDAAPTTAERPTSKPRGTPQPIYRPDGTIDISSVLRGKRLPLPPRSSLPRNRLVPQQVGYGVGDIRTLIGYDYNFGTLFYTDFEVKLISDTVEMWVQTDLRFVTVDGEVNLLHPDANDAELVTPERIAALAAATERIIPVDVEYFGDYADRDGSDALLQDDTDFPPGYFSGPGKRVIVLISNIRDENFYDPVNNLSNTIGFFWSYMNDLADRNIITLDSADFDTDIGPPIFNYEATIAHEFQHLIDADQDPDESIWGNEGRSEFSEFINGYRTLPRFHRTQWSDFPENSLTSWGDQDNDPDQNFEILADYQNAYWFMLYLAGRLEQAGINTEDNGFVKDVSLVTTDPDDGSVAIDNMLERVGAPFRFRDVLNDFLVANLYGGTSDDTAWGEYISQWQGQSGVPIAPLDLGRMRRNLDFEGYDTPGAPPDGADYIEIGWSEAITDGTVLNFDSESVIPTAWQVIAASSTGVSTGANASGNVLYSGHTDGTDNFLIFPISVPSSGDQTLSFDTMYNIETGWDFGFTQVTTDTVGATGWESLQLTGTTTETEEFADPIIISNVPGFTGTSGDRDDLWKTVSYDMSDYSGQDILLAFRYSTDGATSGAIPPPPDAGWYIDNIQIGRVRLFVDQADVPANAQSIYEARDLAYDSSLRLVTFADKNGAALGPVIDVPVGTDGDGTFDLGTFENPGFDEAGERMVALVGVIAPPTQSDIIGGVSGYSDYTLTGLPPTLYTSRARALGTASDAVVGRPSVYPGDTFTMTVTVDNLGRNDDLEAAPADAYVAVPIPANTTFVAGTLDADSESENITYTTSLRDLDAGLPDAPGVYWNGVVSDTADLRFELRAAAPLTIGTAITPTAHFANAPFGSNPSQRFTDIETPVMVTSPFDLSSASAQTSAQLGSTATFTYTLLNTDDRTRSGTMRFTLPEGADLESISIDQRDPTAPSLQSTLSLDLSVPSYIETGLVTVVTLKLRIDPATFKGTTLDPQARFLQPGTMLPWVELPLNVPGGATAVDGRTYLPIVMR